MSFVAKPFPYTQEVLMEHEIHHEGSGALLQVSLKQNEAVKAESNAMVAMSGKVTVEGKMDGGLFGGLKRAFSGEKFFVQVLTAKQEDGMVLLAPSLPGDIKVLTVKPGLQYLLQRGAFLAAMGGADVDTAMQNLAKGFFSGAGFFVQKTQGSGKIAVSAFGAIQEIDVPAGEEFVVDNGHLVAWTDTMTYKLEKAAKSGWFSSATSGEWLVCRFKGPGTLFVQTRNPTAFSEWVRAQVPSKS